MFKPFLKLIPSFIADRISPIRTIVEQFAWQMRTPDGVSMTLYRESGELEFKVNRERWAGLTFNGMSVSRLTLYLDGGQAHFMHLSRTAPGLQTFDRVDLNWNESRFIARAAIEWIDSAPNHMIRSLP